MTGASEQAPEALKETICANGHQLSAVWIKLAQCRHGPEAESRNRNQIQKCGNCAKIIVAVWETDSFQSSVRANGAPDRMRFVAMLSCELVLASAVESIYDQIMIPTHYPLPKTMRPTDTSVAGGSWQVRHGNGEGAASTFARMRFGLPAPPKHLSV